MKHDKMAMALLGLGLSAGGVIAAPAASVPAIYTATQAAAGASVFSANCVVCHGANLEGQAGPTLIGQSFASASNNYTIGAIFSEIAGQMPAGAPGSLTHDQYTQVMAYILSKNGYPSGSAALVYDNSLTSAVPLVSQVK